MNYFAKFVRGKFEEDPLKAVLIVFSDTQLIEAVYEADEDLFIEMLAFALMFIIFG